MAFIRTQILRRIIDWGENAIGPPGVGASYGDAAAAAMEGVAPGSGAEVTVMIWQDQGMSQVTHLPRGTTVGQVSVEGVGGEGRVGAGDSALQAVEQGVGRRPSASGTCDAAIMVLTVPESWRVQPVPLVLSAPPTLGLPLHPAWSGVPWVPPPCLLASAQVFRERVYQSFHPEMPPVALGDLMVNVNNRLVPEETPLRDGDLVILAREKLKI